MRLTYLVHIVAGSLALVAGYIALYAAKGADVHRKAGRLFVYAMLALAIFGATIAAVRGIAPAVNIPAAVVSTYLVVTALMTVKTPGPRTRPVAIVTMLVALAVGLTSLTFGFEAIANGGTRNGMPAFPFFMFGLVGLLGSAGDLKVIRSGPPRGAARLVRHLWRMCFALFIAALSFFIGQAQVIPEPVRIMPLLALPVLAVLATMFYWLWRVRVRRSFPDIALRAPAVAAKYT